MLGRKRKCTRHCITDDIAVCWVWEGVDINFCKAFWSLTEEYGVQHAPLLVCPAMDVSLEFTIPSDVQFIILPMGLRIQIR